MPMDERGNLEFTRQLNEGPLSLRDKTKRLTTDLTLSGLQKEKTA